MRIELQPLREAPGLLVAKARGGTREQRKSRLTDFFSILPETGPSAVTSLGLPQWLSGDARSRKSISFSHARDNTWAALAGGGKVGVDAAFIEEFGPDYPIARVFGADEWRMAILARGKPSHAAALLWSAKEAAAKAAGTGFLYTEPIHFHCAALSPSSFGLSISMEGAFSCQVHTWPEGLDGWVSVAWTGEESNDDGDSPRTK